MGSPRRRRTPRFEDPTVVWGQFDLHPAQNYLYQVQKAAYHPNAVFVKEYNTRFFAGDTVQRTVHAYNDRLTPGSFTLRWRAGDGAWQSRTFALPPAGQWSNTISFPAPAGGGPFPLRFELSDATNVVFTNTLTCSALPRTWLGVPASLKVGLYDPAGATAGLLQRFILPCVPVTNLHTAAYDQLDLLIVGRHALASESPPEVGTASIAAQWQDFALRGGWLLVLEQTNYPAWMPLYTRKIWYLVNMSTSVTLSGIFNIGTISTIPVLNA